VRKQLSSEHQFRAYYHELYYALAELGRYRQLAKSYLVFEQLLGELDDIAATLASLAMRLQKGI